MNQKCPMYLLQDVMLAAAAAALPQLGRADDPVAALPSPCDLQIVAYSGTRRLVLAVACGASSSGPPPPPPPDGPPPGAVDRFGSDDDDDGHSTSQAPTSPGTDDDDDNEDADAGLNRDRAVHDGGTVVYHISGPGPVTINHHHHCSRRESQGRRRRR